MTLLGISSGSWRRNSATDDFPYLYDRKLMVPNRIGGPPIKNSAPQSVEVGLDGLINRQFTGNLHLSLSSVTSMDLRSMPGIFWSGQRASNPFYLVSSSVIFPYLC